MPGKRLHSGRGALWGRMSAAGTCDCVFCLHRPSITDGVLMWGVLRNGFAVMLWSAVLAVCCCGARTCSAQPAATAAHRVLAQDQGRVAIVDAHGGVEWEVACRHNSHDIACLPNGNLLLHTGPAKIEEFTREKKVVWTYTAQPKAGYSGRVEIHA